MLRDMFNLLGANSLPSLSKLNKDTFGPETCNTNFMTLNAPSANSVVPRGRSGSGDNSSDSALLPKTNGVINEDRPIWSPVAKQESTSTSYNPVPESKQQHEAQLSSNPQTHSYGGFDLIFPFNDKTVALCQDLQSYNFPPFATRKPPSHVVSNFIKTVVAEISPLQKKSLKVVNFVKPVSPIVPPANRGYFDKPNSISKLWPELSIP